MFDQFLKGLAPFNAAGSLSVPDANRIYDSYKAAGGGGPVNIVGAGNPSPAFKPGLPPGGIIGLLRGQSPQGLIGMLQGMNKAPIAGNMPQAGMMAAPTPLKSLIGAGHSGNPADGNMAPMPILPQDVDPTTQF